MTLPGPAPGVAGWEVVATALGRAEGADVVDLACAEGSVARWLVEIARARSVLALDLDLDALDRARATAVRTGGAQERVHYEQADLDQATLPFEAYDLVWAPGVLATTADPVRTARMVRAGMRPRGLLVATVGTGAGDRVVAALDTALLDEVVVRRLRLAGQDALLVTARKPPHRRP